MRNMNRRNEVQNIMVEYDCKQSRAEYIYSRRKSGKQYKPQNRIEYTAQYFKDNDIKVECRSGEWIVYHKGKVRPQFVQKTNQYKYGRCKYHMFVAITVEGKQRMFSLSSLIWCAFLGKDIPFGYVIDHIDNDSFNNSLLNLQCISIADNVRKDHNRANQYKYKENN